jgi:hypothetical protein
MQENQYLPVNWADGMKINKSHFIAEENAVVYQIAAAAGSWLNDVNYGLLPPGPGGKALTLFVSMDNQQKVQVRIQHCTAITAGGYYIGFSEDTAVSGKNLQTPLASTPVLLKDLKEKGYYVVLTVNPYKRVPYGAADPGESPARIPYTQPLFSVDLLAAADVTRNKVGSFQLPLGKLIVEDNRVVLDEQYIPPCSSLGSHPELLEIHAAMEQFLAKIETCSVQIVQKILHKKQANDMSSIVHKLCEQTLQFTAIQLAEWKALGLVAPPVQVVSKASALARLVKNVLDCHLGSGKEELINYFTEWCNFSQGELEGAITTLANHTYDHLDISDSVTKVSVFTKILSQLFHQLARLEYIGKRKDSGIFVKEEVITPSTDQTPPRRRSFLAE